MWKYFTVFTCYLRNIKLLLELKLDDRKNQKNKKPNKLKGLFLFCKDAERWNKQTNKQTIPPRWVSFLQAGMKKFSAEFLISLFVCFFETSQCRLSGFIFCRLVWIFTLLTSGFIVAMVPCLNSYYILKHQHPARLCMLSSRLHVQIFYFLKRWHSVGFLFSFSVFCVRFFIFCVGIQLGYICCCYISMCAFFMFRNTDIQSSLLCPLGIWNGVSVYVFCLFVNIAIQSGFISYHFLRWHGNISVESATTWCVSFLRGRAALTEPSFHL